MGFNSLKDKLKGEKKERQTTAKEVQSREKSKRLKAKASQASKQAVLADAGTTIGERVLIFSWKMAMFIKLVIICRHHGNTGPRFRLPHSERTCISWGRLPRCEKVFQLSQAGTAAARHWRQRQEGRDRRRLPHQRQCFPLRREAHLPRRISRPLSGICGGRRCERRSQFVVQGQWKCRGRGRRRRGGSKAGKELLLPAALGRSYPDGVQPG